ncbi:MAG: DUF4350 domain-containing protein [Gammaproteobacteria bacterium]
MSERAVAIALLSVLGAALLALFITNYEKEEYEVFLPPSGEAATNPLLAAQRLLDGLGYAVSSREEFAPSLELPPAGGTSLALFSYDYMDSDELELLLQWVTDGGHLIVGIEPRYGRSYDPVFTPVGIEAYVRVDPDEPQYDDEGNEIEVVAEDNVDIAWDAGATPDREAWGSVLHDNLISIRLGDTQPLWSVHDQFGVFATQIAYNAGKITALADITSFTNRNIGQMDHAFLLTQIIGPTADAGPVWLLHGTEFPSLWTLLKDNLAEVLIGAGLLLLMCLWWAAQRFGPMLDAPARARKAFIEHIEANGRFLWRHDGDHELLASTRQAFLRDAQRRHAPLRRLDEKERRDYLASVCGVSEADVSTALDSENSRRHGDFLTKIQLIKTMWNRI